MGAEHKPGEIAKESGQYPIQGPRGGKTGEESSVKCRFCRKEIADDAEFCSYCGKKQVVGAMSRVWVWAIVCLILAAVWGIASPIVYLLQMSEYGDVEGWVQAVVVFSCLWWVSICAAGALVIWGLRR